jgi:hypothetical protein
MPCSMRWKQNLVLNLVNDCLKAGMSEAQAVAWVLVWLKQREHSTTIENCENTAKQGDF